MAWIGLSVPACSPKCGSTCSEPKKTSFVHPTPSLLVPLNHLVGSRQLPQAAERPEMRYHRSSSRCGYFVLVPAAVFGCSTPCAMAGGRTYRREGWRKNHRHSWRTAHAFFDAFEMKASALMRWRLHSLECYFHNPCCATAEVSVMYYSMSVGEKAISDGRATPYVKQNEGGVNTTVK